MHRLLRTTTVFLLSTMLLASAVSAGAAQAPAKGSATEFYMQYRKAFDAAKKIEDVMPYMSSSMKQNIESTPPAQRPQIFEMIKMMGALTNIKVTKETKTTEGATLTVEALDSDKAKTTGTIQIVKDNDAWKLGKESWSTGP